MGPPLDGGALPCDRIALPVAGAMECNYGRADPPPHRRLVRDAEPFTGQGRQLGQGSWANCDGPRPGDDGVMRGMDDLHAG